MSRLRSGQWQGHQFIVMSWSCVHTELPLVKGLRSKLWYYKKAK